MRSKRNMKAGQQQQHREHDMYARSSRQPANNMRAAFRVWLLLPLSASIRCEVSASRGVGARYMHRYTIHLCTSRVRLQTKRVHKENCCEHFWLKRVTCVPRASPLKLILFSVCNCMFDCEVWGWEFAVAVAELHSQHSLLNISLCVSTYKCLHI